MSASPASVCPKCEPLVASALAAELAREGAAARGDGAWPRRTIARKDGATAGDGRRTKVEGRSAINRASAEVRGPR